MLRVVSREVGMDSTTEIVWERINASDEERATIRVILERSCQSNSKIDLVCLIQLILHMHRGVSIG